MNLRFGISALFFFTCSFYFLSCTCNSVECDLEETNIYFRILSSIDSTDVVFGDSLVYEIDNIKVFKVESSDTTFFNLRRINDIGGTSFLRVDHEDFGVSRMFIDFGNSDIDTLDVGFSALESECCGSIRNLSTVLQNGNLVFNGENDTGLVSLLK